MKCGNCRGDHPAVADVRACYEHAGKRTVTDDHKVPNPNYSPPKVPPSSQEEVGGYTGVQQRLASLAAQVPAGRFAVKLEDGKLHFFKVDKPDEGRWAGYCFIKEQASDELYPVKNVQRRVEILSAIAQDVGGALQTYGREIGKCGRCGRTLTNEESRAYGIGPECRNKGW